MTFKYNQLLRIEAQLGAAKKKKQTQVYKFSPNDREQFGDPEFQSEEDKVPVDLKITSSSGFQRRIFTRSVASSHYLMGCMQGKDGIFVLGIE
jgi:hypothetical protein